MTAQEIFELARTRQALPENAGLAEQALFATARNIYKAFSTGILSLEQAKREKAEALTRYRSWEHGERAAHDFYQRTVALDPLFVNAHNGTCENCKRITDIITGRTPPRLEDT